MPDGAQLKLSERLDLQAAVDLKQRLEAPDSPKELDGSGVVHLGAQALQVLLTAVERFGSEGFRVETPSERLLNCLSTLGVAPCEVGISKD